MQCLVKMLFKGRYLPIIVLMYSDYWAHGDSWSLSNTFVWNRKVNHSKNAKPTSCVREFDELVIFWSWLDMFTKTFIQQTVKCICVKSHWLMSSVPGANGQYAGSTHCKKKKKTWGCAVRPRLELLLTEISNNELILFNGVRGQTFMLKSCFLYS